jgi:hypothetical protein
MADESQGAPIEQAPVLDLTFLLGHNSDGRFGRTPVGTYASAEQGAKADSAVQPADLPALITAWANSLPTSAAGLSVGDWYNNGGTLSQVQP